MPYVQTSNYLNHHDADGRSEKLRLLSRRDALFVSVAASCFTNSKTVRGFCFCQETLAQPRHGLPHRSLTALHSLAPEGSAIVRKTPVLFKRTVACRA